MLDFTAFWKPWQKELAQKHGLTCPPGWYGFACGPGWQQLLDEAFSKLREIGWNGEIHQIKEKFGTLRMYVAGDGDDRAHEIIRAAEEKSEKTCEQCGLGGTLRTDGWWRTLCAACELLREEERKRREEEWEAKRKKNG